MSRNQFFGVSFVSFFFKYWNQCKQQSTGISRYGWLEYRPYSNQYKLFIYSPTKYCQGINSISIGDPWNNSYIHNLRDELFHGMFIHKLYVMSSISYFFDWKIAKTKIKRKNLVWFTWIHSIYWWQKWKSIHQNKGTRLTQRALVPLGPALIYKTEEMNFCLCFLYINSMSFTLFPSFSTSETNEKKLQGKLEMIYLKPVNVFMATGEITKIGTLSITFYRLYGEENVYVQFEYGTLTIF